MLRRTCARSIPGGARRVLLAGSEALVALLGLAAALRERRVPRIEGAVRVRQPGDLREYPLALRNVPVGPHYKTTANVSSYVSG